MLVLMVLLLCLYNEGIINIDMTKLIILEIILLTFLVFELIFIYKLIIKWTKFKKK